MTTTDVLPCMPSLFANAAIRSHYRRRSDGQAAVPRERLLLDLIRRAGQCERSDLPRASGLSVLGIKGIIDLFVADGLLQLGSSLRRGRGQPSAQVRLVPEYVYSVGVLLMVDGIAVVLIDFAGQVRGMRQFTAFPLTLAVVCVQLSVLL